VYRFRFRYLLRWFIGLILMVAGCQPSGEVQPVVGVLLSREDLASSLLQAGFREAATRAAVRLVLDSADGQVEQETGLVTRLISSRPSALIVTPVSPTASYDALARARDAGIPVVCFRTCVEPADIASAYVTADDRELGSASGDAALELIVGRLGGEAQIGILTCGQDERCQRRRAGFLSRVRMLQAEVVAEAEAGSTESARAAIEAMLSAHPEINLIWAADRQRTVAAVGAVRTRSLAGRVFVLGTGIDDEILAALQAGDDILQGVADYSLYQIGFVLLDAALAAAAEQEAFGPVAIAPVYLSREDPSLIQAFQQSGGRLVPTPATRTLSTPTETFPACSTCNPKAHPVIPTP